MGVLAQATQQQRDLAAYLLLIAAARLAEQVPEGSLVELTRLLEEGRRGSSRKAIPANPYQFFEEALTEAEYMRLPHTCRLASLDEEIALMWVRLVSHAKEHPEDFDLLLKRVAFPVRAVATRYRLSPAAKAAAVMSPEAARPGRNGAA